MVKFLLSVLEALVIGAKFFAHFFVFIAGGISSEPRRRGDVDDEEVVSGTNEFGIARTSVGVYEPTTTSARGDAVGVFSGARIK